MLELRDDTVNETRKETCFDKLFSLMMFTSDSKFDVIRLALEKSLLGT